MVRKLIIFKINKNYSNRLTAYTALSLNEARPFIYVDDNIVQNCLKWLVDKQGRNGSFVESGAVIHTELQSRNGNSLALTAFVLMVFIENQVFD